MNHEDAKSFNVWVKIEGVDENGEPIEGADGLNSDNLELATTATFMEGHLADATRFAVRLHQIGTALFGGGLVLIQGEGKGGDADPVSIQGEGKGLDTTLLRMENAKLRATCAEYGRMVDRRDNAARKLIAHVKVNGPRLGGATELARSLEVAMGEDS